MSLVFAERSLQPERIDLDVFDEVTTARILRALETINLWLGGIRATLGHLERFSRRWEPGAIIRMIDWGTGGADVPRAIVRWARRRGFRVDITAVDNNPVVIACARRACAGYPEIQVVEGDCLPSPLLPLPEGEGWGEAPFDYALSSLTLHHLSDAQILDLLKRSDRVARRGLIMNDLKRSARAWAWIWALSRVFGADPIVCADGPLSVRRAFTRADLDGLARQAGLPYLKVSAHFGYRLTLAGEKK